MIAAGTTAALPVQTPTETSADELQQRIRVQQQAVAATQPAPVIDASRSLLALALRRMGDLRITETALPQAIALYRQSLDLEPSVDTQLDLAAALLRVSRPDESLAQANAVLGAHPDNPRALLIQGTAFIEKGSYAEAVRPLSRSLDMRRNVDGEYALGLSLLQLHQQPKASVVFAQMLVDFGDKPVWHVVFGGAYHDTGYLSDAAREFRQALAMDPSFANARGLLAQTYREQAQTELKGGQREQGEHLLEQALQLEGKSGSGRAQTALAPQKEQPMSVPPGVLSLAEGNSTEPPRNVAVTATENLYDPVAPESLRSAHFSVQRVAEIGEQEKQLRHLLATAYDDWGNAEARLQQYPLAIAAFHQAELWDAATPSLFRSLGSAAFAAGNYTESARAFELALLAEPSDKRSREMLGMSYFSLEKYDDAAKAFAPVSDLVLEDSRAGYAWAISLVRTKQDIQADQVADKLTSKPPPADALEKLCHIYLYTEDYARALDCFRKTYAADPSIASAHFEAGTALVHLDRPSEAIPEFQAELKRNPDDANAEYYLAFALLQTSHQPEAVSHLQHVLTLDPNHAQAQYQVGKLLLEDGHVDEAIQHLEIAVRNDPGGDFIHYQLQSAYRRAGRQADADREMALYRDLKANQRNASPAHSADTP